MENIANKPKVKNFIFESFFSMPNANTLDMKKAREVVLKYSKEGLLLDPFARKGNIREYLPSKVKYVGNDLNSKFKNDYNEDFNDFLNRFDSCDILIGDPPYSPTQIARVYDNLGIDSFNGQSFYHDLVSHVRRLRPKIYIQFGWHSNGLNDLGYGNIHQRNLRHGGAHPDTIITVWENQQSSLEAWL